MQQIGSLTIIEKTDGIEIVLKRATGVIAVFFLGIALAILLTLFALSTGVFSILLSAGIIGLLCLSCAFYYFNLVNIELRIIQGHFIWQKRLRQLVLQRIDIDLKSVSKIELRRFDALSPVAFYTLSIGLVSGENVEIMGYRRFTEEEAVALQGLLQRQRG